MAFMDISRWMVGLSGIRYYEEELGNYVSLVTSRGGALTFDVGTLGEDIKCHAIKCQKVKKIKTPYFGYIDPTQIAQIKALKKMNYRFRQSHSRAV